VLIALLIIFIFNSVASAEQTISFSSTGVGNRIHLKVLPKLNKFLGTSSPVKPLVLNKKWDPVTQTVKPVPQSESYSDLLKEYAKEFTIEFLQSLIEELGGIEPATTVEDAMKKLKKAGVSKSQILAAIRTAQIPEQARIITNEVSFCTSNVTFSWGSSASFVEIDNTLFLSDTNQGTKWLFAYKGGLSIPSVSSPCSILGAYEIYPNTLTRFEVGIVSFESCSLVANQDITLFDECASGKHNLHINSCAGGSQSVVCNSAIASPLDCGTSRYQASSFNSRGCSSIPLSQLCAWKSAEQEKRMAEAVLTQYSQILGPQAICVFHFDINVQSGKREDDQSIPTTMLGDFFELSSFDSYVAIEWTKANSGAQFATSFLLIVLIQCILFLCQ